MPVALGLALLKLAAKRRKERARRIDRAIRSGGKGKGPMPVVDLAMLERLAEE